MKPSGPMVVEIELLEGGIVANAVFMPEMLSPFKQAVFAPGTGQYITSTMEKYTVHCPQHFMGYS